MPLGWLTPKQAAPAKKVPTHYRLPSLESIVSEGDTPCYAILNGWNFACDNGQRVSSVSHRSRIRHRREL